MATKNDRTTFVIADTSGLVSLFSPADRNHVAARAASQDLARAPGQIIVSDHVFTETMNVLGKKAGHAAALEAARHLRSTPPFLVAETWGDSLQQALTTFARVPQSVSFTDCIVMAVADHFDTKQIFGFDEAFGRNGYEILKQEEVKAA
jgi:predicted nucleic acid-binding protein